MITKSQQSDLSNQLVDDQTAESSALKNSVPRMNTEIDDFQLDIAGTLTAFPSFLTANVIDNSGNSRPIIIKDDDVFDPSKINKTFTVEIAAKKLRGYFDSQQKWEGRVNFIKDESFVATVMDLTNPDLNDGEVEIDLSEVMEDDRDLIKEGAIFYWNIGQYRSPDGVLLSSSMVRFRRLPSPGNRYRERLVKAAETYFKNSRANFMK